MSKQQRSLLSGILLGISLFFCFSVQAGWDMGNAGDALASEFVLTAKDILQRLKLLSPHQRQGLDLDKLRIAIERTEIHTQDRVFLRGQEVDAANYPELGVIRLSRTRWVQLSRPSKTRLRFRLVLHEYLWMMGVKDLNYVYSDPILERLDVKNYSPGTWWNPVNPVNYIKLKSLRYANECFFDDVHTEAHLNFESHQSVTKGECRGFFRRVEVLKTSSVTPPSSYVNGLFHRFEFRVFDSEDQLVGQLVYEPEWGRCLLPENGSCQASGTLLTGDVFFELWFFRN